MVDEERRARFESLAAQVYEPLQRYLARRASPPDAGEALGDTLTVMWRSLDDLRGAPLPWCYGIARRVLANQRRGEARRQRLVERVAASAPPWQVHDAAPAGTADGADDCVLDALGALTAAEAEVVRLWAWEELEPREIAEVVGSSPNAVSVALSRAKRKLAAELARQDQAAAGHERGAGPLGGGDGHG